MITKLKSAIIAALKAGEKIMEIYNDPNSDFQVEKKADNSPLTIADKAAHEIICNQLEPLNIPILSEEGKDIAYEVRKEWDELWIVDPLDGTKEFIKKNGEFTVNIALVQNGKPVVGIIYVPATKELYYGAKNMGSYKACGISAKCSIEYIEHHSAILPLPQDRTGYTVVASRSHLSPETEAYIKELEMHVGKVNYVTKGSSIKIVLVAEGSADNYPRFAPTMEWDTAAGDAILRAMELSLIRTDNYQPLIYNKENLLNPYFTTANEF